MIRAGIFFALIGVAVGLFVDSWADRIRLIWVLALWGLLLGWLFGG